MTQKLHISLVVPVFNEFESIPELAEWVHRVCTAEKLHYELLFVDDGSTDSSWEVISQLANKYPQVQGLRLNRNYGKSAALQVGFEAAQGEVVITMDADLQDSPDEIPTLYRGIMENGHDMISGWKKERHDPISKTIPSKFFNFVTRKISGIRLHDFNCGLKAYRKQVVKQIKVYGEMHRYIPVMVKAAGFTNIGEQVVKHYPRKYGSTKFGLERFLNGFLDLLSITFVIRFSKKPMHFFGLLGTLSFLFGFMFTLKILWDKVDSIYFSGVPLKREVTEQPLFFLALVAVLVGVQLFLAGFLAELWATRNNQSSDYVIAEKTHATH
jgi:glycosyltransferase involved in cell wall biosynthesis